MVKQTRQNWLIGSKVNVGFLKELEIVKITNNVGNGLPDKYTLKSNNNNIYEFIPHNGLHRIDASFR